ncbi:MAG: hypothetical protein K2L93_03090 [Muribaculaceae bacterium]|nr:hypothetical protein [Muribaculaceae bacterium]
MADDYLGKKMEDYRRNGPTKTARRSAAPSYLRPGHVQVPFTPLTVLIVDGGDSPLTAECIARELRSVGCRVALAASPLRAKSAQSAGCRFYPITTDDLTAVTADINAHWGTIDMTVKIAIGRIEITWPDYGNGRSGYVAAECHEPEAAGRLVRCLAELGDFRIFAPNTEIK